MHMFILLFAILLGCAQAPQETGRGEVFVAFGDSNTRAASTPDRWVSRVSPQALNFAEDGTTVSRHLEVIQGTPLVQGAKVLYLSGYNDMRYYGLSGIPNYKTKLKLIFESLKNHEVYIGNCLRMPTAGYAFDASDSGYAPHDDSTARAYSDALAEVALDFPNVRVVDVNSIEPNDSIFYDDHRHLNSLGHAVVAERFKNSIAGR